MAGLQSNIEHLSSKIQDSLVSHAGIHFYLILTRICNSNARIHRILSDKHYLPGVMKDNDNTGAFHYNVTTDSVVLPHTNGLPVDAQASQMIHQEYDIANGKQVASEKSEMYLNASKRNDQMQGDLYLSNDQTSTVQNNFVPNTIETAEMYQQQEDGRNNEEYTANDSNVETYMMGHDQNQYDEYDPSQYPEEQYVNGNQFNVIADQTENNQTISDIASTETPH